MNDEDIREFEHTWEKGGRHVRILHFPELTLAEIDGPFSAQELRRIASFLDDERPDWDESEKVGR